MKIKVGAINFLNTKPLIYGLEKDRDFELIYETPSRCSVMLEERRVDIAILPSVEYASQRNYFIIPNISISSKGKAGSILLFAKKEVQDIKTISLDKSSRTSAALLKILCLEKFKISPGFTQMNPDLETMLSENDAALVIGDNALFASAYFKDLVAADLGQEWYEMTSLPFVFAFWTGYSDIDPVKLAAFSRSAHEGMKKFHEIALNYSYRGKTYPTVSEQYFVKNMSYNLGDEEKKGLELYFELCFKHKLIEQKPQLRFFKI